MVRTDRRGVLGMAGSLAGLGALPAGAADLIATPPQSTGPFYPLSLPLDADNDLVMIEGRPERASGTILHLAGRVRGTDGHPVRGARIEIW